MIGNATLDKHRGLRFVDGESCFELFPVRSRGEYKIVYESGNYEVKPMVPGNREGAVIKLDNFNPLLVAYKKDEDRNPRADYDGVVVFLNGEDNSTGLKVRGDPGFYFADNFSHIPNELKERFNSRKVNYV